MRIANRQFLPKLWATGLYLSVMLGMVCLGNWQLDRAALKVSMQQAAEVARDAQAAPITLVGDFNVASRLYTRVSVSGRYLGQRQFLWDNRTHKGQAGFEVITPMQLDDGRIALINRGWVPLGLSRTDLPDVSLPGSVVAQTIELDVLLSQPSKGFASGDAVLLDGAWPRVLQFFDYDRMEQVLGHPVFPAVLQPQALSADGSSDIALQSRPEWLRANWQAAASGPAKHYSYAFQWFAMALALTILFIVVNTRKASSFERIE